jgi:hypothetical protein
MANTDDFYAQLRTAGLRKRVAKSLAGLNGKAGRASADGVKSARKTADDLSAAADEIRKRLVRRDRTKSQAARKAAATRKRNAAKRSAGARRGAKTRARVASTRARAKKARTRR